MSNIITIGFLSEGPTDERFLKPIIRRTFENVAFDCAGEIEVFDPVILDIKKGSFMETVVQASKEANQKGLMVLCIHTDADDSSDSQIFKNKIVPAFRAVSLLDFENSCQNLVPIVPVQMTEAWLLADKILFKEEIGTNKSDNELGIEKDPESYSNPKSVLNNAISIELQETTKRRRKFNLGELYLPIGQKISTESLRQLGSYKKFEDSVREVFKSLNYLYES